jgi:nucleoid-associated protein YgaU
MTEIQRARAGLLAVAGLLLAVAPTPAAAVHDLRSPAAADPAGPLVAAVALLAELLLCWLLVVVAATSASRLPGWGGPVARRLASRIAPVAVRRLVEVSLGVTVVVGAAVPASAGTVQPSPAALDWPSAATSPAPAGPDLDWPSATRAAAAAAPADRASASTPSPAARLVPRPVVRPVDLRRTAPSLVTVEPGDSLWAIAADHLPAGASDLQIAQAWPSWWAANRDAVGADPDLIHPGTQLDPPTQS